MVLLLKKKYSQNDVPPINDDITEKVCKYTKCKVMLVSCWPKKLKTPTFDTQLYNRWQVEHCHQAKMHETKIPLSMANEDKSLQNEMFKNNSESMWCICNELNVYLVT